MDTTINMPATDGNRRVNLAATLRAVHADPRLPRSAITRRTGLSRASIAGAIGELEAAGIIRQLPATRTSRAGRPSPNIEPTDRFVTAAVMIDVTGVRVGLYTLGGQSLAEVSRRRQGKLTPRRAAALTSEALNELTELRPGSTVVALGAAVPGWVDRVGTRVENAPTLDWVDVPMGSLLAEATGLESQVVYDAVAGLVADRLWGPVGDVNDAVYLYGGPGGIGAAVMVEDRILHGRQGHAGRLGHLTVANRGPRCICGNVGCLASTVSATGIAEAIGASSSSLTDLETALAGRTEATNRRALAKFYRHIAVALRIVIHAYDPSVIMLDGFFGLLHDCDPERLPRLLAEAGVGTMSEAPRLVSPSRGANQVLAGVSHFAFSEFIADPLASRWTAVTAG